MIIKYYFDLECTVHGGVKGTSPEAQWNNNKVLLCGWTDSKHYGIHIDDTVNPLCNSIIRTIESGDTPELTAHNAKFDIKWLMRERPDVDWTKCKVHDTMTYEYRESGQFDKLISLEKLAKKYNVPFKKSLDLGALLKAGVQMEDIPISELTAYLEDDVKVLKSIADRQTYNWDMDYILPLAEMELNGLTIDRTQATTLYAVLATTVDEIEQKMIGYIKAHCCWQDGTDILDQDFTDTIGTKSKYIKPTAARTLSFLLTGNPASLKITNKWHVRWRGLFSPVFDVLPDCFENPTHLGYPVGEEVLSQLNHWIPTKALEHRIANKVLGTYVSPFLEVSALQGTIHPKLNTTITATGRLSSSSPNGQNIPPSCRELIVPAAVKGSMVEVDFSQLEIVAVACVSGCPELQRDIKDGVDVHYRSGKSVFGWKTPADMNEKDRKVVKNVNFGLLYGGKPGGLAKQTGVDREIVQELMDSFYDAYPGVRQWQKDVFTVVTGNLQASHIDEGEQVYSSEWTEPFSGRKFKFVEQKLPKWLAQRTKRKFGFSPMQTSNYPIQGFAGGDIVMFALTQLWRELHGRVRFVMTVHDSIIMEAKSTDIVRHAMDRACKDTVTYFGLPTDLKYDITVGQHWS